MNIQFWLRFNSLILKCKSLANDLLTTICGATTKRHKKSGLDGLVHCLPDKSTLVLLLDIPVQFSLREKKIHVQLGFFIVTSFWSPATGGLLLLLLLLRCLSHLPFCLNWIIDEQFGFMATPAPFKLLLVLLLNEIASNKRAKM